MPLARQVAVLYPKHDFWLVLEHLKVLNSNLEAKLYSNFYDEEEVLKSTLLEVKRLKKEGADYSLLEILKSKAPPPKAKKRKPKPKAITVTKSTQKEFLNEKS